MPLNFTLASRNLFHDRLRFVATMIGIVFSVVLVMVQMGLFLGFGQMAGLPILDVGAQRHFLAHPMGLLLALPAFIGPGIALHVICAAGGEKPHLARSD